MKRSYAESTSYVTKDGSLIRELIHPLQGIPSTMSLAEALIPPGVKTLLHVHQESHEIYYILQGSGGMQLGDEDFGITAGDSILILPRTPHRVSNTGENDLKILCCCTPPYSHEDTEICDVMT